jgi:hypothetical protein
MLCLNKLLQLPYFRTMVVCAVRIEWNELLWQTLIENFDPRNKVGCFDISRERIGLTNWVVEEHEWRIQTLPCRNRRNDLQTGLSTLPTTQIDIHLADHSGHAHGEDLSDILIVQA